MSVQTETLDGWWRGHGRPSIDVVKVDAEGAELLILRGADEVLAQCRPTIFLEISQDNLRVYPYGAADVREHLQERGYGLEPLEKGDFVARPR